MLIRAQVALNSDTGLPRDRFVNTFHFTTLAGALSPVERDSILARVRGFYLDTHAPETANLMGLLGGQLSASNHTTRLYDAQSPPPNAPLATDTWAGTPGATQSAISEQALCLSFRAPIVSGTNPRRRRGRVYIGPWGTTGAIVVGDMEPGATQMNRVLAAGRFLMNLDTEGIRWVVAGADGPVEITHCWVDNAWDIQRRRGRAPTARVTADG